MEQMKVAEQKGLAPMRPLFVDFPADAQSWNVEDQFMFGPDILVAPVLEAGLQSRSVYLPAGCRWRDAWSGAGYDGGMCVSVDTPLQHIPVFIRAASRLQLNA
jgi:alpha-D-xyloside xylohydrolase